MRSFCKESLPRWVGPGLGWKLVLRGRAGFSTVESVVCVLALVCAKGNNVINHAFLTTNLTLEKYFDLIKLTRPLRI